MAGFGASGDISARAIVGSGKSFRDIGKAACGRFAKADTFRVRIAQGGYEEGRSASGRPLPPSATESEVTPKLDARRNRIIKAGYVRRRSANEGENLPGGRQDTLETRGRLEQAGEVIGW